MNERVNHPTGPARSIAVRSIPSIAIGQHAAVVRSARETMVRTVAAVRAEVSEVIAAEAVRGAEVEAVFEEAVAGANGVMGLFLSQGDLPDARPRLNRRRRQARA